MQNTIQNAIPDWSRPGLSMTAIGTVAQQGDSGNYLLRAKEERKGGGEMC